MKYLMFALTYVTLAVLANGCGVQKAADVVTLVRPNIPDACYLARIEDGKHVYQCPSPTSCLIKADDSGHILASDC